MASDYLLEIEGIKGESQDSKFKDSIEILSFNWGVQNSGTMSHGTGGGAGKASFQDLHVTQHVNKASPQLMLACATGKHHNKAVLHVRKQGGKQEEYYKIVLTDVLVSSYNDGGSSSANTLPTEQVSLNFAKIEFEYAPQNADGSLGAKVNAGYDLKKNEKV